ncbi:hypothetical protein GCM10027275_30770 [Rhabdobacter roseus]|uniref:Uncharacterized protein n=1 Tax=Rhabdobacter roseus TaxID=1655419 RepID=A0A840TLF1_9BACT|nr:hypothetical protein [Rhabdobacter roseus]MBB5285036.1 hypothetical protein [Rhabdobacter roseus]
MAKRKVTTNKGWFTEGNEARRIKNSDLELLVDQYCEHLSRGYSKHTFAPCDYRTIEQNATESQAERVRSAAAKGLGVWERIVQSAAFGLPTNLINGGSIEPNKVNTALLIFTMKNKLGAMEQGEEKRKSEGDKEDQPTRQHAFTVILPNDEGVSVELDLSNIGAADEKEA